MTRDDELGGKENAVAENGRCSGERFGGAKQLLHLQAVTAMRVLEVKATSG